MSVWYPKNKGKVRGWVRRARHVEEWRQRHLALDERWLSEHGRGWAKLWIDPWYRLVRRDPPAWLRRHMVAALLDVHRSWHEQLQRRECETGEPFDCMLWLLQPHVVESQVVFASGERLEYYRDTFTPSSGDVPSRPPEAIYGVGTSVLEWAPIYVAGYTTVEDLAEDPDWARVFQRRWRRHVLSEQSVSGQTQIQYRIGEGWIGRIPGAKTA